MWDCDYGNYKDMNNDRSWFDDFSPIKAQREEAKEKFDNAMKEILEEIADDNGIPYEEYSNWGNYDWDTFRECMDL